MADWRIVKHDHRSRDGDVYEGDPIHTVVPAQPGYSVIELFEDGDEIVTCEPSPVLAWAVKVTPTKTGSVVDRRVEAGPMPVTLDLWTDKYAIREPSGRVVYQG